MLLPRQRSPSAKLTMSAPAANMLLSMARARSASSHSGGGPSQAVGTNASSAPPAAAQRACSGKRVSKQIQPVAVTPPRSNTGTSPPGDAHEVSAPNRCSLRYTAATAPAPSTTTRLSYSRPSVAASAMPNATAMPEEAAAACTRPTDGPLTGSACSGIRSAAI